MELNQADEQQSTTSRPTPVGFREAQPLAANSLANPGAGSTGDGHRARRKILLTEGTSLSARHTLYALGGQHTIDVIDPAALCQGRFSRNVRRWRRSPSFSKQPAEFLRFLAELLLSEQYDVVLPTHEQVYLLSRYRDTLAKYTGIALPAFAVLDQMQNKATFTHTLDELGLPYPSTTFIRNRAELVECATFPCYIKLAHSTAGCGVHLVRNAGEVSAVADQIEREGIFRNDIETLVQQPARGTQATVQAIFQYGQLVGAHCFSARALGVGGMSSARVSVDHPIVFEHVARLGAHLDWHGAIFIDYFYDDETGRPEYLEANPRIGETVNGLLSGVNLCELLVRVSLGEELATVEPKSYSACGARSHSGFMILLHEALEGATRRALAGELWRRCTGRGLYRASHDELTRPRDDYLSLLPEIWIAGQLLLAPSLSKKIVRQTIDNYALPESATHAIRSLPEDLLADAFRHAAAK